MPQRTSIELKSTEYSSAHICYLSPVYVVAYKIMTNNYR